MAATPSAATGATGLERLLLIFLMKLSESQNAADDTYFSHDRLSDQSEKTARNCARKLKNNVNLQRKPQPHQKPALSHRQPNERKNSNSTERITHKQQKTSLHRTKLETNGGKMRIHRTKLRQIADDGCTSTQPRKNFENLQELTPWMGSNFTRPHCGRLMILPVDRNAGNCLAKDRRVHRFEPPFLFEIYLKNLQRNRAAPLRPIALQRPSQ